MLRTAARVRARRSRAGRADKLAWLQERLIAAGNLPQRYDLSRVVNTELRAEAVRRAGLQN